jgi:hypothetical protein
MPPIRLTEKDLYALIGEQAAIIRVQEQMIARLQEQLEQLASPNGRAAPSQSARPDPSGL